VEPKTHLVCDRGVNDEAVWRKHSEELVRYASILVGPSDAEDLLSAVVVRVLAAKGSLSALEDARPYLFRAVLNESKNHRRRFRPTPHIREAFLPGELRPEVLEAAMLLPPQQRAAVYLTYWRDLPIREPASLMGCRPGTVRRYLVLARRHLRELLTDE
jgi:RNA polymerase sigma factor (sigma-70 family)